MNAPLLDAPKFETGLSDPRLAECLKEFPPAIFSERLYQSIELMERYSIELAVDLLGQLNLADQLGTWRSADELCSVLGFQPRFRLPLHWILTRLIETGCVEVQSDSGTRSYRLRKTPWQPDLRRLRALALNIDPGNAATLDLLEHAASFYRIVATGEKKRRSKSARTSRRPAVAQLFSQRQSDLRGKQLGRWYCCRGSSLLPTDATSS